MIPTILTPAKNSLLNFEVVKEFLKIDDTNSDDLIVNLITVATKTAEEYCRCAFMSQSWSIFYDADELDGVTELEILRPPLIRVDNVYYYTESDVQTVFASTNYRIDKYSSPGRLSLKATGSFPSNIRETNSFEIQHTAGYGELPSDVPEPIKQAIKIIVTNLYENRESGSQDMPTVAQTLLDPYKVHYL